VLMPGGGAVVPENAKRLYENAINANDAGDSFPIWGTCNGFEWLLQVITLIFFTPPALTVY
jgi:gamma-glutamyl hydrolase